MALEIILFCSNVLYAEGIQELIDDKKEFNIIEVFTGNNFHQELKQAYTLRPDVILLDTPDNLHELTMFSDVSDLHHFRILLIGDRTSPYITGRNLKNLISKGVVGILPPSADATLLKKALKAIHSEEIWLDRKTILKLLTEAKHSANSIRFAPREHEIVSLICQGYTNKEIAQKLNISEQTVKSHCHHIYKKIGVSDRLQLALYSYKMNLYKTSN